MSWRMNDYALQLSCLVKTKRVSQLLLEAHENLLSGAKAHDFAFGGI